MRDDLRFYYERELTFLRQMGAEFAEKYPGAASRLFLEPHKCEDPHVERLLQGFAFLAARVHLKIDDEFPEITEAILNILYPHYLRPIPSMSVVEFEADTSQVNPQTGLTIGRSSVLRSRPVGGAPCKFRTCYESTIWPIDVVDAGWTTPDRLRPALKASDAVGAIRVELRCPGDLTFKKLSLQSLRFYLSGESALTHTLYELLCNNCVQVVVRDPTPKTKIEPITLPASSIQPVGFDDEEGMLPYTRRSFTGYRLLQEYFCFPQKYFFLDLTGLDRICAAGFSNSAEIVFLISPFERSDRKLALETGISAKTFRLNCAPVVNLFSLMAEPISLDQSNYEYPVVPDVTRRNAMEVFSVDDVTSIDPQTGETVHFEPLYSFRHTASLKKSQAFWHSSRRESTKKGDEGTEIYLSLVETSGVPKQPDAEVLNVRVTCTNRDLPSRLPFGNEAGDFELEGAAPIKRITALIKPTDTLRPQLRRHTLWWLVSQLSLNYLSLVSEGREALQGVLRLHNFSDSSYLEKQIEGLAELKSKRRFARVASEEGVAFARGTQIEIEFDEEQFVGGGMYLFASVLERFLGLYVTVNSFSQLVVRTRQRKEIVRQWPPRAGQKILI